MCSRITDSCNSKKSIKLNSKLDEGVYFENTRHAYFNSNCQLARKMPLDCHVALNTAIQCQKTDEVKITIKEC